MDKFTIQTEIPVDIKIKSAEDGVLWYFINVKHMMCLIMTENQSYTGNYDRWYGSTTPHLIRQTDEGLKYYGNGDGAWHLFEEKVQRLFSDYVAEKELLGDSGK